MAENQVITDKMAVSVFDQGIVNKQNDFNHTDIDLDRKTSFESSTKKKSCFQITRVITKSGGSDQLDGDVDDDLDETNTEEVSSVSIDASKTNDTDIDQAEDTLSAHSIPVGSEEFAKDVTLGNITSSTPHAVFPSREKHNSTPSHSSEPNGVLELNDNPSLQQEPTAPDQPQIVPHKEKPSESRFKVVKIESKEPFRRGRWSCQDYLDPPFSEKSEKDKTAFEEIGSHGSGNSSTASSVHFVPGLDDPSRNPLVESQNGEFGNPSSSVFNNGSHIGKNTTLPSQHIPNQVPNSMTQTHMQNVLPPSEIGNQFAPSSSIQQGSHVNGQSSQSQQSFSQANMSSQSVSTTQQSQGENVSEYIPSQTEFIPNTALHQNAQNAQEGSLSQDVQSSNNIRNSESRTENTNSSKTEYNSQDIGYTSNGSREKTGQQSDTNEPEPREHESLKVPGHNPLLEMVAVRMSNSSDKDDDSGASTVAIDNKIEQAMDLVKSHLMYAVREEVEVLREQIKELLEKNSQLEWENSILRQAASAETLNKLQQPRPRGGGTGGNTGNTSTSGSAGGGQTGSGTGNAPQAPSGGGAGGGGGGGS